MSISPACSSDVPVKVPRLTGDLNLVHDLFSNPDNVEYILGSFASDDTMEDLIIGIWNHPNRKHEEKTNLIEKIAPHLAFAESMIEVFKKDPLTALFMISSLDSMALKRNVLDFLLKDHHGNDSLMECWKLLEASGWDDPSQKSEPLELLLASMTSDERESLFIHCIEVCSTDELARLSTLLSNAIHAEEFITSWGDFNDYDDDYHEELCLFIHYIIAYHNEGPLIPPLLTELLSYEGEEIDTGRTALDYLEELSDREQGIVLSCLLPLSLDEYIKYLDPMIDREILIDYMEKILSCPSTVEAKTRAVSFFLERIQDEDTLTAWLTELQNRFSPAARYVWPALSDAAFAFVATDPTTVSLRSNLMRIGTLTEMDDFAEYTAHCRRNGSRINYLFTVCTLDIASQEQMQVGGESFGRWMTFIDFAKEVRAGITADDLTARLGRIKDDFQKLPPLLLGLGMTYPAHRIWIVEAAPFCSDDQLKAIAKTLTAHDFTFITRLSNKLMADQYKLVLEHMKPDILRQYAEHQVEACRRTLRTVRQANFQIRGRLTHLEADAERPEEEVIDDLLGKLTRQSGKIGQLFNNSLTILVSVCSHHPHFSNEAFWLVIPQVRQSSKSYRTALRDFYQRFDQLRAPVETVEVDLDKLPQDLLLKSGATFWQDVGIFSGEDLHHLGYSAADPTLLEKYLSQPNLIDNWKTLKSKSLHTISSLIEAYVAEPGQLFDLASVAGKLV